MGLSHIRLAIEAMIGSAQATQALSMASEPVSIFFFYSRKDEALMRELESHLEPLRLSHLIKSWHEGYISPGTDREQQIEENLANAQIILLLVSANFISSKYCNSVELAEAINRHKAGDALVIPLILKPCMWQPTPVGDMTLGDLQPLPQNALPVTLWDNIDEAYTDIAEGLYEVVDQMQHDLEFARLEQQRNAHYDSGLCNLEQNNYYQAILDFNQAGQLDHPWADLGKLQAKMQWLCCEDDLSSERGIDYSPLRDLLKAKNWEAADLETYEVISQVSDKTVEENNFFLKKIGDFPNIDFLSFPCTDLVTIDQLWLKYSEGHFGFSAQREILITELGTALDGNYPDKEIWNRFGDLVGWQVNEKWLSREALTYDLSAQRGHLPSIAGGWYPKGGWISIYGRPGLLVRVESCEGL